MNIYLRLKDERERLGFSQEAFGSIGGVQKRAQINYEKGERHPDSAYLAAIAAAGADVLYILTGQHAATAGLDRARAEGSVAAWQQSQESGLAQEQRRRGLTQTAARAVAAAPPDEALLLAAFRGADAPGRAALLLAARAIAALNAGKAA